VFDWSVDIVMDEVAPELPGIALPGEKLQVDMLGNPEQDSATELLKASPKEVR